MTEQEFLQTIYKKSLELNMNPLLLLSGVESLYSFRDVQMNALNFELLDGLILTIFALRVGDQFHSLAEENLKSKSDTVRMAAAKELTEMDPEEIAASTDIYLHSFAKTLSGKSPIRYYHVKALEVAAIEIKKEQEKFKSDSIGNIMLALMKTQLSELRMF
jgi:hypothetical protein